MRSRCTLLLLLFAVAACGCTVRNVRRIDGSGRLADVPDGPTAVLRVTAAVREAPRSGRSTWGLIPTPNAADRFAEQFAHAAEQEGGMRVVTPAEVRDRLREAGLEPTLQPDEAQLRRFADALGLSSYLTAHLDCSRLNYRFFWSWATVRYSAACRVPGRAAPAWRVQVLRKAPHDSDRVTTATALKETFQWLKSPDSSDTVPPCE